MVMEAKALEAKPVGPHEVRITKVYTVEAGHETGKHDVTPNFRERDVPQLGTESFRLRIDAVAGRHIYEAGGNYDLIIKAVCLTNPLAVFANFDVGPGQATLDHGLTIRGAGHIAEAFTPAFDWEYESEDLYTKSWSIHFPQTGPLFASNTGLAPDKNNQVEEVWQFFVILEDTTGGPVAGDRQFVCMAASEPFLLISQRP